jgi:Tol biopolymer transport system component
VYERDLGPTDNGLWMMRADGSDNRRLTRNRYMTAGECGCDTDPNFSPNGKFVSFVRVKRDEVEQGLFVIRADGSGLRQLTPYSWEVATKHDWSPDGKLIVLTTNADFIHSAEAANLMTIRPDGSGKHQLTHFQSGEMNGFAGSFSPDGKQIVFRLETGTTYGLAVIGRNGGNITPFTARTTSKPRYIDWGTHQ